MAIQGFTIAANSVSHGGTNGRIQFTLTTNPGTNPEYRIYLDGSGPPAWTPLPGSWAVDTGVIAAGFYVVEFKNDEVGPRQMAKVRVYAYADSCYNVDTFLSNLYRETQSGTTIYVSSVGVAVSHFIAFTNIGSVPVDRSRAASIDGGVTFKPITDSDPIAIWTHSELEAMGLSNDIPNVIVRRTSNGCVVTPAEEWSVQPVEYAPMVVEESHTNETTADADDGTITLSITGGSGSRTYEWADGPITQNRINLAAGTYFVTVTDNITDEVDTLEIVITQPAIPQPEEFGSFLELPFLQDLFFIVDPVEPDGISTFQGLDNVMLCKQRYGLFEHGKYEQKVCLVDTRTVQINSDYANHEVQLIDVDGNVVDTFPVTLVETNIGKSVTFPVSVQYHSVGKSRVYFAAGNPPISLEVGNVFEILNNLHGYNGTYTITDIVFDSLKGYSYLVVNLSYVGPNPTSAGLGRFIVTTANYNVFEAPIIFSPYDPGIYQVKVRAFDSTGNGQKVAWTEPIDLQEAHPDTVLVEYRNFDNCYNMLWSLGYIGRKRIEGIFGHRRVTGGELSTTRNASFDLITTSSRATRGIPFEIIDIPPYIFEIMGVVVKLDYKAINKVEVQTDQSWTDPQFQEKSLLFNASIRLEQVGWTRSYNSNDVGTTVNETGFIISDGGLVKSS